jgi:macrodomain Ter protein organizer (MatP/YcbG family)
MTTVSIELDDQVLARLRRLAATRNITLSEMVQRLIEVRLSPPLSKEEMGPMTRAASGMAPPMSDEEVERVLDEERMRKYGT